MKYIAVISDGIEFKNFVFKLKDENTSFVKISQGRAETSTKTFIKIHEIDDCRGLRFNDVICLIHNQRVEDEVNGRLTREVTE